MLSCIYGCFSISSWVSKVFNMSESNSTLKRSATSSATNKPSKLQRRDTSSSEFWKAGLLRAINDPNLVVDDSSGDVVVIKDKYPKAKYHYLILPKTSEVNKPRELTMKHLELLKIMRDKAVEVIKNNHPKIDFKLGFHAKPSMDLLHLHVISKDFVSPYLKTKKHWNSFNTEHFLSLSDILEELEKFEKIKNYPRDHEIEAYLKKPLKCNQCSFGAHNMPKLKEHLQKHLESKEDQ